MRSLNYNALSFATVRMKKLMWKIYMSVLNVVIRVASELEVNLEECDIYAIRYSPVTNKK